MITKLLQKCGDQWDKDLPYIFFTYREVLQAGMSYSPFKLESQMLSFLCVEGLQGPDNNLSLNPG